MTKWKSLLLVLLIAAVLIGGLSCLSFATLRTANPVTAVLGLIRVVLAYAEYAVVDEAPLVIVAKPETSLDAYRWENGNYLPVPGAQLGAVLVYRNNSGEVRIHYSVNGYFAKWEWLK